ncbi:hypothetical protein KCP77_11875 [Salmonella enterica subsp. enterica]|nr:hypothetical protein KCP77_11875 [Salmonella enterica subsp. enterica]
MVRGLAGCVEINLRRPRASIARTHDGAARGFALLRIGSRLHGASAVTPGIIRGRKGAPPGRNNCGPVHGSNQRLSYVGARAITVKPEGHQRGTRPVLKLSGRRIRVFRHRRDRVFVK